MLARDLVSRRHEAILFHTTSTALLAAPFLRGRTVLSLDSTPASLLESSAHLGRAWGRAIGGASERAHASAYRAARALTPWSAWVQSSLVLDYDVDPGRITVIPPGVDVSAWQPGAPRNGDGPLKLLFVGRDFGRKGGDVLLRAFTNHLEQGRYELDVVTKERLPTVPGVRVHHELPANSDALRRLYEAADVFVLPTRWDTFGIAAIEAMASGLPVVASDLNAVPEIVADGSCGMLVRPGDPAALASAVTALGHAPELRRRMGAEGRRIAEERFDVEVNARRVLDVLKRVATESQAAVPEPGATVGI
jgi:glycosyltransferase involved in cell wall biosynthesis